MEALSRLAGVQDASRQMQPHPTQHEQPPIPQGADLESQTHQSVNRKPSRASLPLDRRPSRKSLYSNTSRAAPDADAPPIPSQQARYTASRTSHDSQPDAPSAADDDDDEEDDDEMAWGPQHPCFPHPNPHVAPSSPLARSTRIIRVQRDWLVAGDLYPAFQNVYPEVLAEWVDEAEFRALIEAVNRMLERAFTPFHARAVLDAVLGVLTGFLWDDAGFAGSKAVVGEIEEWMDEWNKRKRQENSEVRLIPLRRTGFLTLDIQIPDPEIDLYNEDGQEIRAH